MNNMAKIKTVIVDAIRSPIGVKRGIMAGNIRSDDLTAQVIKKLLERNPNLPLEKIEDVVLGCAFPEGPQGMLLARTVSVLSGIPIEAGAKVVNRFCGSSMDAVHQLSQAIGVGDIEVGIAAGVEDMFSVPMGGFAPDFHPGLAEQDFYIGMGETAENLAKDGQISREDQDDFSIASHKKALKAHEEGRFENEVVPIELEDGTVVDRDEGPMEPNVEKIRSLNPAFIENGTVTAASSSPISLGASAAIITSESFAKKYNLSIRAEIMSRAIAGVEWDRMGKGPLPATKKALSKIGMDIEDMDAIELNEAFAAQSLYVIREGGWPMDKINLNGGAIALGHPLGCSGVRIITTLVNVLEQIDGKVGLATMCIGSGQGIATIIRRKNGIGK
ncbi:MAG: thiolase family protein [Candidatus Marinimicrobia bacterium]|nr:thiolase family protein [Candidatus Neomarinimicrobiota bacterium]